MNYYKTFLPIKNNLKVFVVYTRGIIAVYQPAGLQGSQNNNSFTNNDSGIKIFDTPNRNFISNEVRIESSSANII